MLLPVVMLKLADEIHRTYQQGQDKAMDQEKSIG